jgi:methyltransferase FkbM-like protein
VVEIQTFKGKMIIILFDVEKPDESVTNAHLCYYMTFDQILKMQNHSKIHVLKMDIEGGKYSVFVDLLKNISRSDLPYQIAFETHWWNRDIYHAILHMSLFSQLWTSGYRLLQYELNDYDPSCVEWTFMRMFC